MLIVPDTEFGPRQPLVIAFNNRFLLAEFEMAIQPAIKSGARNGIIIVWKVLASFQHHVFRRTEQGIELLEFGETLGGHLFCPIIGASHALRLGREEAGELDVAGADTEQTG